MTALLALIVIGTISASGGSKKADDATAKTTAPDKTATVVDVKAFGDEFEANQVAAEAKYKEKYVQMTAPITNITDSGLSFQNVTTKQFSMTQISCNISDKNKVLSLKNGETVTFKGKVTDQTIGVISLTDCEVIK